MPLQRPVPISVLDLAPIGSGQRPGQALRNSIDLAIHAERWGYRRHWVAEHHNMPGVASSAPAVLIAHLASATTTIRVGSGGVMLPNHAPLVVAEQFGMLEAIHPGRIDLGIGRAPGTDPVTAAALRRTAGPLSADEFPEELAELVAFFEGAFPGGHPYSRIRAVPGEGDMPELWLLGSTGYSAQAAAYLGLPFAFAHHFSPANTEPALRLYRERFRPSGSLAEPYALVAVAVVCADTDERAAWLHGSSRLSVLRLRSGTPGPLPTPEEAADYPYTPDERERARAFTADHVVGGPETVRRGLDELLARTRADELMITTNVHDHGGRLRSFELVAHLAGVAAIPG
ncbi:MAG TPA: LLM class flavin-dependent oxidoreductase [Terriglobales bacterium]|nr:LLM class flavin-dependent oxidoreductase [Terriglobales bacterium]